MPSNPDDASINFFSGFRFGGFSFGSTIDWAALIAPPVGELAPPSGPVQPGLEAFAGTVAPPLQVADVDWGQLGNVGGVGVSVDVGADLDGDGLTQLEEAALGTLDTNKDSDGDGIDDRTERDQKTRADRFDSDGDGIGDLDEQYQGTNALVYDLDTDRDGLSDTYERSHDSSWELADSDSDGLTDREEYNAGSDALRADTDGDGLADGLERDLGLQFVSRRGGPDGVDFDARDTDMDGVEDGVEFRQGRNANGVDADTDGDGIVDMFDERPDQATTAEELATAEAERVGAQAALDAKLASPEYQQEQAEYAAWLGAGMAAQGPLDPFAGVGAGATEDADGDGMTLAQEYNLGTSDSNADSDGDGVRDGDESLLGTDATRFDSDGDGLSDGAERDAAALGGAYAKLTSATEQRQNLSASATYRKTAADTDGDGLSDEQEVKLGTDATRVDSDGDGLSDSLEQRFGTDALDADSDDDGLTDGREWAYGSNARNRDTDGDGWEDAGEVAAGSGVWSADSDGDGINDRVERFELGSDFTSRDTDRDGLTDDREVALGTKILVGDTDGDGLSDGFEVNGGWNYEVMDDDERGNNPFGYSTSDVFDADTDDDGLTDGAEYLIKSDARNRDTDHDDRIDSEDKTPTEHETDWEQTWDDIGDGVIFALNAAGDVVGIVTAGALTWEIGEDWESFSLKVGIPFGVGAAGLSMEFGPDGTYVGAYVTVSVPGFSVEAGAGVMITPEGTDFRAEAEFKVGVAGVVEVSGSGSIHVEYDGDVSGEAKGSVGVTAGPLTAKTSASFEVDEEGNLSTAISADAKIGKDAASASIGIAYKEDASGEHVSGSLSGSLGSREVQGTAGIKVTEDGVDSVRVGVAVTHQEPGGAKETAKAGLIIDGDGVDGAYASAEVSRYIDPATQARAGGQIEGSSSGVHGSGTAGVSRQDVADTKASLTVSDQGFSATVSQKAPGSEEAKAELTLKDGKLSGGVEATSAAALGGLVEGSGQLAGSVGGLFDTDDESFSGPGVGVPVAPNATLGAEAGAVVGGPPHGAYSPEAFSAASGVDALPNADDGGDLAGDGSRVIHTKYGDFLVDPAADAEDGKRSAFEEAFGREAETLLEVQAREMERIVDEALAVYHSDEVPHGTYLGPTDPDSIGRDEVAADGSRVIHTKYGDFLVDPAADAEDGKRSAFEEAFGREAETLLEVQAREMERIVDEALAVYHSDEVPHGTYLGPTDPDSIGRDEVAADGSRVIHTKYGDFLVDPAADAEDGKRSAFEEAFGREAETLLEVQAREMERIVDEALAVYHSDEVPHGTYLGPTDPDSIGRDDDQVAQGVSADDEAAAYSGEFSGMSSVEAAEHAQELGRLAGERDANPYDTTPATNSTPHTPDAVDAGAELAGEPSNVAPTDAFVAAAVQGYRSEHPDASTEEVEAYRAEVSEAAGGLLNDLDAHTVRGAERGGYMFGVQAGWDAANPAASDAERDAREAIDLGAVADAAGYRPAGATSEVTMERYGIDDPQTALYGDAAAAGYRSQNPDASEEAVESYRQRSVEHFVESEWPASLAPADVERAGYSVGWRNGYADTHPGADENLAWREEGRDAATDSGFAGDERRHALVDAAVEGYRSQHPTATTEEIEAYRSDVANRALWWDTPDDMTADDAGRQGFRLGAQSGWDAEHPDAGPAERDAASMDGWRRSADEAGYVVPNAVESPDVDSASPDSPPMGDEPVSGEAGQSTSPVGAAAGTLASADDVHWGAAPTAVPHVAAYGTYVGPTDPDDRADVRELALEKIRHDAEASGLHGTALDAYMQEFADASTDVVVTVSGLEWTDESTTNVPTADPVSTEPVSSDKRELALEKIRHDAEASGLHGTALDAYMQEFADASTDVVVTVSGLEWTDESTTNVPTADPVSTEPVSSDKRELALEKIRHDAEASGLHGTALDAYMQEFADASTDVVVTVSGLEWTDESTTNVPTADPVSTEPVSSDMPTTRPPFDVASGGVSSVTATAEPVVVPNAVESPDVDSASPDSPPMGDEPVSGEAGQSTSPVGAAAGTLASADGVPWDPAPTAVPHVDAYSPESGYLSGWGPDSVVDADGNFVSISAAPGVVLSPDSGFMTHAQWLGSHLTPEEEARLWVDDAGVDGRGDVAGGNATQDANLSTAEPAPGVAAMNPSEAQQRSEEMERIRVALVADGMTNEDAVELAQNISADSSLEQLRRQADVASGGEVPGGAPASADDEAAPIAPSGALTAADEELWAGADPAASPAATSPAPADPSGPTIEPGAAPVGSGVTGVPHVAAYSPESGYLPGWGPDSIVDADGNFVSISAAPGVVLSPDSGFMTHAQWLGSHLTPEEEAGLWVDEAGVDGRGDVAGGTAAQDANLPTASPAPGIVATIPSVDVEVVTPIDAIDGAVVHSDPTPATDATGSPGEAATVGVDLLAPDSIVVEEDPFEP